MPTINLWLPCTQKIVNMLLKSHESNKYFLREYYLIPILLKKTGRNQSYPSKWNQIKQTKYVKHKLSTV